MPAMTIRASNDDKERFLALLRQIRIDAGMRQEDLAEKLGQPQSFVSRYESGERRVDLLELERICGVLGVSLGDFVARYEGGH